MPKFKSNSRPLNKGLEKNAFCNFNAELSQLSKTVRDFRFRRILTHGPPYWIITAPEGNIISLEVQVFNTFQITVSP